MHAHALAVDSGVGPRAFDDQPQRRLRVPVTRRNFAGEDQLPAGVKRVGDRRLAGNARVLENQHAAYRFLRRDQAAGLHQPRPHLAVFPQSRHTGRLRLARHQCAHHFPQRREMRRRDAAIVSFPLRARIFQRLSHFLLLCFRHSRHIFAAEARRERREQERNMEQSSGYRR